MSQLTPEDFRVWGKQKSSAQFDKPAGSSGPIGGYDPNKKAEPQAKSKSSTTAEAEEAPVVQKKQDDSCYAKVRLKGIELVAGDTGVFEFTKGCRAKGTVEILQESAAKRATVSLVCRYKGEEYDIEKKDAQIDNGTFDIGMTLYYADPFFDDYAKDKTITCEYVAKLSHGQTTTVIPSTPLTMPQQKKTVVLKKGMYDDNVQKEKSGNDYIAGSDIKTLQTNLNAMNFACGTPEGGFGPKTEVAVKLFQKYATESRRLKKSASKLETVTSVLQGSADGIVGEKTAAEIREWIDKKYVKPVLPIRHGEYDDEGASNGKGSKGSEDHHQGTPVADAQKDLKNVAAYSGSIDGWFWDKMKSGVELFQDAAAKGQFLINGVMTDIGEKLIGHRKGVLDTATQEMLMKVKEKGGEVPNFFSYVQFLSTLDADRQKLLSDKSRNILGAIAKRSGFQSLTVTSTIRYPKQQAEAMYNNLKKGKRLSYAPPGMAVTAVYDDCVKAGLDKEAVVKKMVEKINSLSQEGKRVSKHCVSVDEYNKLNIVDIGVPSENAKEFICELAKEDDVQKIYHDISGIKDAGKIARLAKEPCIHVEIKQ